MHRYVAAVMTAVLVVTISGPAGAQELGLDATQQTQEHPSAPQRTMFDVAPEVVRLDLSARPPAVQLGPTRIYVAQRTQPAGNRTGKVAAGAALGFGTALVGTGIGQKLGGESGGYAGFMIGFPLGAVLGVLLAGR